MTNRTLNRSTMDLCECNACITFMVQQGEINVYTDLPYTDQLSVSVPLEAHAQWLIGRSGRCAIVLRDLTISHQHTVLGYDAEEGFYIMDVQSRNGTFLNQSRLPPLQRHALKDRDRVALTRQTIQIKILYKNSDGRIGLDYGDVGL
jgi:pSer/pThr/pTyr-binding forkhead associated (FHA) protein